MSSLPGVRPRSQPYPLGLVLRVHLMRQWLCYADEAMEEVSIDQPSRLRFAGLDGEDLLSNEGFTLRIRRTLKENNLVPSLSDVVNNRFRGGPSGSADSINSTCLVVAPATCAGFFMGAFFGAWHSDWGALRK